ncbi:hypothetical protein Sjap_007036 [Stephania japonica]|uniref:X8 domain-containing protein n=1 Tax=Stephania japonica TaxID=461633 RepID=A0AAP0K6Y7_9MAGN
MAMSASSALIIFFALLHVLSVCSSENVSSEEFIMEQEQTRGDHFFHSFNRKLNNIHRHISEAQKTTLHDALYPPTTFPETPVTNPVTTPANPTPTIVTVSPTNPSTTPIPIPSTTPITVPPINPVNYPPPITVPGTTPMTNPVTTNPFSPPVTNPVTTPTTNPVMMPPATTTTPTGSGQSWCVAKSGTQEAQLQTALDYACGSGIADCTSIQQTGSCYNPNSLQYHASYAFNSYYQKNPVTSSCDFGGTAMIVNINPSIGSCVYPSSSTSAAAATAATTGAGTGAGTVIGPGSPSVLNASNPAAGTMPLFGTEPPPSDGTTISTSVRVGPMCQCIVLTACILTARLISSL